MLILSRKKGQKLIINDNIEVVIIDSDNGVVKIGINAPKEISIFREEVYIELKKTNKESNNAEIDTLNQLEQGMMLQGFDNKLKSVSVKIAKNEKK